MALLQGWGAEVSAVADVHAARAALMDHRFDVLLLDWQLANGETAQDLLADFESLGATDVPAIAFLTANRSEALISAASKWGAPILPKPVDPASLRDFLDDVAGA